MKKIALFEEFDSMGKIGNKNLLPWTEKSVIKQIGLYKMTDGIYAVRINDMKIRAFLFLRCQEYYEGTDEDIRSKRFNIDQYIKWYMKYTKHADLFTYQYDWSGFNIPSPVIEECMSDVKDPNEYDRIMNSIIKTIRKDKPDGNFYLLGVNKVSGGLLEHEMAHGMYFTDPDYKQEMDTITKSLPKETKDAVAQKILDYGYPELVVMDEIQAYMSTGLSKTMNDIPNVEDFREDYISVFHAFMSDAEPQKMPIDYN